MIADLSYPLAMLCPTCSRDIPEVAGPCPKCGVLIPAFALPANAVANRGVPKHEVPLLVKALVCAVAAASAAMGINAYLEHGAGMATAISELVHTGNLVAPPKSVNLTAARAEEHALKLARELEKGDMIDASTVIEKSTAAAATGLINQAQQGRDAANARASSQDAQIENLEKR